MAPTAIAPGYTTQEKVRAALGVTDNEVLDEFFSQDLGLELEVALLDWLPTYQTIWAEYQAQSPSTEERQKGITLQLYSQWFCAAEIAMMWLAMPQRISDGKVDMRRFANLDLQAIADNAEGKRDGYQSALLDLLDPTNPATGYGQTGAAPPDIDAVTGL